MLKFWRGRKTFQYNLAVICPWLSGFLDVLCEKLMEIVNKTINMPIDQWPEYVKVINQIETLLVNTSVSWGLLKGFPLNLKEKEMRLSLQFVQSVSEEHVRSYLQRQNDSKAWKSLNCVWVWRQQKEGNVSLSECDTWARTPDLLLVPLWSWQVTDLSVSSSIKQKY